MHVTDPAQVEPVTDDHPTGALGFRYLLAGEVGRPESFMLVLAETRGRFEMIRHRHNFDQFRFAVQAAA